MIEIIKKHYMLNRTAVNPDTDKLVEYIKREELSKSTLREYKSGTECFTWIIPKAWRVREAYLSRLNGEKIVDFKDHPLHLWTHSVPFEGEVSLEELKKHLYFDPAHPDWIPYHYRNGYNYFAQDWGFSMSYNQYLNMISSGETKFYVRIDADLDNNGTMKVLDYHVKGKHPETIFFAAHTCHPGIVTDGLSCVAVLTELFKRLEAQPLRYSYRLILGPEYFAAIAFLSSIDEEEIKTMKGGIFLDMIGNNKPFGYQTSFQGNSFIDIVVKNVFQHHVKPHVSRPYRKLWGNDEMVYNGPGFNIPTVGIGCDRHEEYHFDADNMELLNYSQLEECLKILEMIINIIETNYVPVRKYRGPLYLSRYNLYIDPKIDQAGYDAIEYIQILMNGKKSCLEIADELGLDYFFVKEFCDKLAQKGLIEKHDPNF